MKKERRIGRTSLWPMYSFRQPAKKTLAIIEGDSLYLETGEHLNAQTFAQFVDILFHRSLLSFTQSLSDSESFPYLTECVQDKNTKVVCNKEGIPTSIKIQRKSSTRWIVPFKTWGKEEYERKYEQKFTYQSFMSIMRHMYDYFGVGEKPTPSSSGVALLLQEWSRNHFQLISGCNAMCAVFIYNNRIGARCEKTVENGTQFESLLELDAASFYAAMYCQKIPCGTSMRCHGSNIEYQNFFTFFCRCTVTIKKELALGSFPVKKSKQGKIQYPTLPGTYETCLWREQAEDARRAGCMVQWTGYGYGWHESTEDMTIPSQKLYSFRVNAPNDWIEKASKQITTGAYGRFGMNSTFYSLVDEEASKFGERPINDDNFDPLNYYVHEEKDYKQPSMIHWYSYNLMQGTRTLYALALPFAIEGRLIMTNYDAIIVLERDETHRYAQKYSAESLLCAMGDLRWKRLTNVTILNERSLKCDQYTVMPGVKR